MLVLVSEPFRQPNLNHLVHLLCAQEIWELGHPRCFLTQDPRAVSRLVGDDPLEKGAPSDVLSGTEWLGALICKRTACPGCIDPRAFAARAEAQFCYRPAADTLLGCEERCE
eukprot:scaffold195317_cov33-Tisochrysis_lutea.AAC.2